jgi:hypothetical protein
MYLPQIWTFQELTHGPQTFMIKTPKLCKSTHSLKFCGKVPQLYQNESMIPAFELRNTLMS